MIDITRELDLKGLKCPFPILRLKQTLTRMETGEIVKIIGTEPGTEREVKVLCKHEGHEFLDYKQGKNDFTYFVRKG